MKLTITYELDPAYSLEWRFWASTRLNSTKYQACGRTYEEAKARLIERIRPFVESSPETRPPEPEEIEIGGDADASTAS